MFTGIITNTGKVIKAKLSAQQLSLAIRFQKPEKKKPQPGESIAVNGVCLTVRKTDGQSFEVDVVRETLAATTFGQLKINDIVNLERSLKLGDEIGGHFVTGHVDARGRIAKIVRSGKNVAITIEAPDAVRNYLAPKGSVTVDGISLTVQSLAKRSFTVAIIPHTLKHTTLSLKKEGAAVNLEVDLVARYMKIFSEELGPANSLKQNKLKKHGF